MLRTLVTTAVLATALTTAMVPAAASAHDHDGYGWQDDRGDYGRGDDWRAREWQQREYARRADYERRAEWQRRAYQQRAYQQQAYGYNSGYGNGYYVQPQTRYEQREAYIAPAYNGDRGYRCHSDGTAGAVIGAIAGGLLGHSIVGRGDRTTGALVGGAGGLFAGRAIERSGNRC